jgi:hypothetical protein
LATLGQRHVVAEVLEEGAAAVEDAARPVTPIPRARLRPIEVFADQSARGGVFAFGCDLVER